MKIIICDEFYKKILQLFLIFYHNKNPHSFNNNFIANIYSVQLYAK